MLDSWKGAQLDNSRQILWEDGERVFCRGWRQDDNGSRCAVLAVLLAAERPPAAALARFAHEYELRDVLDAAWAAKPLALSQDSGRTALLLEDPGGEPLERLIGKPMDAGRFLPLAIGIVSALGSAHRRGLIHKDVKPANILVNCADGQTRLTGFGVASRLARGRQAPEPSGVIVGTPAYMAPEQTGRMSRSVDTRSDLYSLGVTFFQMLSGGLPFRVADPIEWFHRHIARMPAAPAEGLDSVPVPISEIVMKLLAKSAEDRYQLAVGVEHDLKRCLAEWERRGRVEPFALGERDRPDRLMITETLYGREREVESLLAAFERTVANGIPELVLVSGYSGVGKTSVVNELRKALAPLGGSLASGKCDQLKRDIPYSTLAQAFGSLVRSLLGKSDTEMARWRDALLEALGPNGRLMTDIVPELKFVIGLPSPVPELEPQQAQARIHLAFRRFIGVFAAAEHPLALFLDDLQWLDGATLDLIEDLLSQAGVRHLLLVGAYRSNEVDADHPLMRKFDAISVAGGKVVEIALAPLKQEHFGYLIADALRCEAQRAASLAQLIHAKTGGNPFFAIQYLSSLTEDGLLSFDYDAADWLWNIDRICARPYSDNVADLMVGKLGRLPDDTQEALRQLACLGNVVELSTLAIILGTSEVEIDAALLEAVRLDLVERLSSAYRFVHDRVQEAAYSLIPQAQRAAAHLRIGRLLLALTSADNREETIFEIVNHLDRGAALISEPQERAQLADLNLIAARRAKASTAYASALAYFSAGAAFLPQDSWKRRHDLAFALELGWAECEFLTGAHSEAEQRLVNLVPRALSVPDLAAVARLREDLYMTLGRSDRVVDVCLDYLRHVEIAWSARPTKEEVRQEYERIWRRIGSRSIEELLDLPPMTDPEQRGTMEVLVKAATPARFIDQNLEYLVIGRMVNFSLEHGNSDASCYAYALVGAVLGSEFGDYSASSRFGKLALDLVERRGLDRFEAGVYLVLAIDIIPWTQPIRGGRSLTQRAFEAAERLGDRTFAGYSCAIRVFDLIAVGDPLRDVQIEAEGRLDFVRKLRSGLQVDIITPPLQLIRTLRGLTPIFGSFNDAEFDEARFERHLETGPGLAVAACLYWVRKLQALVLACHYATALAAAAQAERFLWTSVKFFQFAEYHLYAALARAALCETAFVGERAQYLEALAAHHRQLQTWAANCPENFENRAALVGAEIARLNGREIEAERLYEEAIRSARANAFVHNEALAYELAARFYEARGFQDFAQVYRQRARDGYQRWGADGKVKQLEEMHPHLRMKDLRPAPTRTIQAPVASLDLATVIKLSQAISGEIVLKKLLETLMRTAIEHAGAERVLLIAPRGDVLRVEAEATTSSEGVAVHLPDGAQASAAMPESLVRYVIRTEENVILEDASTPNPFSADPYLAEHPARSILCLPLVNKARLTGILFLENTLTPRVFSADRISVLTLVASHAAIALENARLYRRVEEREKHQAATSKMLRIISSSPIQSVLDAVAENAARLSDAGNAEIFRLEDNLLRLVASYGEIPVVINAYQGIAANRETVTGRAACDRRTIHVYDLAAEVDEYPVGSGNAKREGHHTTLATPLLREDVLIGVILVRRREVRPYSDEEVALIETFADQAVIAIENARLFEAEKRRALALAHANRDLEDRERKIRRLVESNIIGVFFGDFDGRIFEANNAFLGIVGYDRKDLAAGRINWRELTPHDWRDRDARWIDEHKRTGVRRPIEKQYFRKDGSRVPILMGAATFEEGGSQSVTFVLDLTERKQAEENLRRSSEALRRSEAYLAEAERLSHSGTWAVNVRHEPSIVYWSEESYRIYGLDPLEGLPTHNSVERRIHPDDRSRLYEVIQEAGRQKRDYAVEFRLQLPDGAIRNLEAAGHHLFSADGEVVEVMGTHVDVTERKRAEHALQESEFKLRQIIDTVPGLIWSLDADGSPTHVSQRLLAYSGMRLEDFKRVGWKPLVHPDDLAHTEKAYRYAIQTGTSYHGVLRLRRADGEYRWHHARCEPLRDQQGRIIQWYGLSVDIDEAQLQAILNVIPAYAWYAAPSGALIFANNRTSDLLGLPTDHPLRFGIDSGAPWDAHIALFHPDDREESRKAWLTCLNTGAAAEFSQRVLNADGGYRWFLSRAEPLRASDGTLLMWVGVNLDIEELKRAEAALRESEKKFRDYAETASDWFWEIDSEGKFTLLTENAFGSNAATRIGTACWDQALDLETEPEKWQLIWTALDSRQPFRDFVYRTLSGNGASMHVRSSGKPVFDADGRFRGYRGTGSDVTAAMRALEEHERLRQLESDLAHMNRLSMMGELAASLAHEIAQPVGSARNNARAALNFLDKRPPDLREVKEALSCVVGDAVRAGAILDRIRDYIKKAPPKKDYFDLNQAINEVVALARSAIGKYEVSVQTRLSEGMALVRGDRVQLQQVVLNLILNAIEAMSGVSDGARELAIGTEQSGCNVFLVTVRDSGPGIDLGHLEHVFDAFYTTKAGGVGMGLSICRSIISAHGGRLWADANERSGAIFRFTLPSPE